MSLRRRLMIYLAVPALLLAMLGGIGLISLHHLQQTATHILANNYRSIQEVRRMERAIWTLELVALLRGEVDGRPDVDPRGEAIAFERSLSFCEGNITEDSERPVLERLRTDWEALSKLLAGAAVARGDHTGVLPLVETLRQDLKALVQVNEHAMFTMEEETRETAWLMKLGVGLSLGAALLALVIFGVVAARRIDDQQRKLDDAQSRLALVMSRVLEGMLLVDESMRVLAVNPVAAELLGCRDTDAPLGRRLPELDVRPELARLLELLAAGDFQPERDLGEFRTSGGASALVYRPRVVTIARDDGGIEGYLVIFWDVTEEKRFEEARHRFISMLSHQLKTPMTSLSLSVNMLRERLPDLSERAEELLDMAIQDCQSMSELITELVDAARGTSPDLALQLRRVDLKRLLGSALKPLAAQAGDAGVTLSQVYPRQPCQVAVDPVKFPWVVTNLVGNALRYTAAGGTVTVAIERRDGDLTVTVADTGSGMPATLVDRIFRPYVSADPEPSPGTHGLGLAIVREIVEAHRGTIEVESEVGRGTRFVVRIPALVEDKA